MVKMRDARDTLLALGSLGNVVVTKDDASGIRMKATWQDSRFTLTLTGNTGYVFIQGPSASLLAFGSHVAGALDGVLHVAKDVGTDPRNPDVQAGGDPGSDPDPETSPEAGETVTEEAPGLSPESEQQQHQHTGAEPESEPAFVASGAGSSIVSGQGNVMVNVTLSENTDAPAQVEGLANMLRNLLRLSTGQGREGAA